MRSRNVPSRSAFAREPMMSARAEKVNHLGAIDELELGKGHDAVAVERGLEGEVEAVEGFDGGKARHQEGRLDPATLAQRELLEKDLIEGADAVDLALLDTPDGGVEDLERARHAEADEATLDAVEGRGVVRHDRPPILLGWSLARRSPTAW